jgi:hypothetical protein
MGKCISQSIKEILSPDIQEILKISYDGLDQGQQNIFLDIACFLKGYQNEVIDILTQLQFLRPIL